MCVRVYIYKCARYQCVCVIQCYLFLFIYLFFIFIFFTFIFFTFFIYIFIYLFIYLFIFFFIYSVYDSYFCAYIHIRFKHAFWVLGVGVSSLLVNNKLKKLMCINIIPIK